MADNLIVNGTTYENVENIELLNTDGETVRYYNGTDIMTEHNADTTAHTVLFEAHNMATDAHSDIRTLINNITVPTKTSELENDSGYLTNYTETDPTVPAWAKESTKPTYTAEEVGAAAEEHTHDLTSDVTGILPVTNGGTGVTNLSALATTIGAMQIKTGTYTGTGTHGSSNPTTISTSFTPKLVIIAPANIGLRNIGITEDNEDDTVIFWWDSLTTVYSGTNMGQYKSVTITANSSYFRWYSTVNASLQLNTSGTKYAYLIIG